MDFSGKVCVVTGASSGIGRRVAQVLAGRGARVCVAARRGDRLEALVAEIGGAGAGHSWVVTDVSKKADVDSLRDHVQAAYGRCHVLVNNAGFSTGSRFDSGAVRRIEAVMATNFLGAVNCTGSFLPLLEESAPSHVVNIASVAGRMPVPGDGGYCASKFALVGWSESIHYDLAERGVHVSIVEPGPVRTEGFPLTDLAADKWLRHALTTQDRVAAAIVKVIERPRLERVVPRWFYLLRVPYVVAPWLFHAAQHHFVRERALTPSRV